MHNATTTWYRATNYTHANPARMVQAAMWLRLTAPYRHVACIGGTSATPATGTPPVGTVAGSGKARACRPTMQVQCQANIVLATGLSLA